MNLLNKIKRQAVRENPFIVMRALGDGLMFPSSTDATVQYVPSERQFVYGFPNTLINRARFLIFYSIVLSEVRMTYWGNAKQFVLSEFVH